MAIQHPSLFDLITAPEPKQPVAPPRVWTVKSLVSALTRHVEQEFPDVRVEGEVSNCKPAPSGHVYFTLKDGDAQITCVLFRSQARLLRFRIEDGLQVQVRGRISVYESRGQMQLIAESIEPMGDGAFRLAYEKLRMQLQREGLFDAERKRPLPAFAARIGVVTSPTGSVIQDILNILARRYRGMGVAIYPAAVQGASAAAEFRSALAWFDAQTEKVDVIVLARGGGSFEDLHCFNDEALARAITACSIPVISAIGHETDFTIADFAADLRAPTPSAAAEIITAQHYRVEERILELQRRNERSFRYRLAMARESFHQLVRSHAFTHVRDLAAIPQQRVDDLCQRMASAQRALLARSLQRVRDAQDRILRPGLDRRLLTLRARCEQMAAGLERAAGLHLTARRSRIDALDHRLAPARRQALTISLRRVHALQERMLRQGLDRALLSARSRLTHVRTRMLQASRRNLNHAWLALTPLSATLEALNPLAILDRGYAVVYGPDGELLRDSFGIASGDLLTTKLAHESIHSRFTDRVKPEKKDTGNHS